jgi:type I restriction-modification system DNA methylase subunit
MALFQVSVLNTYLKLQEKQKLANAFKKFSKYFHNPVIQENIRNSKEEQFQATFLTELFVNVLGYTLNPQPDFNLSTEFKNENNACKADGAILKDGAAIGVIELKGTNTKDLEGIRRQAFDYKVNQKSCLYVITSNFEKLRFYINDATEFIEFDLFLLTEKDFAQLYLCLQKENVLNNLPLKIKESSVVIEEQITKDFYKDYSVFKRELYRDLVRLNAKTLKNIRLSDPDFSGVEESNPDYAKSQAQLLRLEKNVKLELFKKSQKLIDRFLFIFFAEDRGLLPPNSTIKIVKDWNKLKELDAVVPLYDRFKLYFSYLDQGRKSTDSRAEIFAYNGGLFKPDNLLDRLELNDELLAKHTTQLSKYNFESQVDVNILGHIFENSLNEIESINAEIEGADFDKQKSKRKKDGVFYTPKYITKYIVENTLGKLCEEKKTELGFREEEYYKGRKRRQKDTLESLVKILDDYRAWLLKLTICDPACGSGAFLNQALDFLIKEHHYIDELKAKLLGGGLVFSDIETTILENNIYGVDINEESIEIAKLSLWLRTAQPRRKLNDLSSNIKCGNSLIDDKKVTGDKAFKWEEEFKDVFAKGGFDVVIGNPPYVARSLDKEVKKYINSNFSTAQYQVDLYVSFIEKGALILKPKGRIGYIVPNSWLKNNQMSSCRNFILKTLKIEILIPNLDNVFAEASVDTMILIAKNIPELQKVQISEFQNKELVFKHSINQERFLKNKGFILDVEINDKIFPLIEKTRKNIIFVGDILDITRGVNPYDSYTGQSQEIIKSRAYHSTWKKDETFVPELKGQHIGRYYYNWDNKHFISYGNWLAAPRQKKYFEGPRLIFREIIGKTLISTLITEQFIIDRSLYIARIDINKNSEFAIEYVLGVLNSKLMAFYFRYTNNEFDALFPKIRVAEFKNLPIKLIKSTAQNKLKSEVNKLLKSQGEINKMISIFTDYLVQSYKLDKLSKKIQNWHNLEFGEFIKELNKAIKANNKVRTKEGYSPIPELTKKDEFEWMELFEENKKKSQDLKNQINSVDKEIDAMVYELYGLTEEEIKIVENS